MGARVAVGTLNGLQMHPSLSKGAFVRHILLCVLVQELWACVRAFQELSRGRADAAGDRAVDSGDGLVVLLQFITLSALLLALVHCSGCCSRVFLATGDPFYSLW